MQFRRSETVGENRSSVLAAAAGLSAVLGLPGWSAGAPPAGAPDPAPLIFSDLLTNPVGNTISIPGAAVGFLEGDLQNFGAIWNAGLLDVTGFPSTLINEAGGVIVNQGDLQSMPYTSLNLVNHGRLAGRGKILMLGAARS